MSNGADGAASTENREPCEECGTGKVQTVERGFQRPTGEEMRRGQMGTLWYEDVCDNPDCPTNTSDLAPAADTTEGARLRHDG